VLARVESYINGVPAIQSSKLELDRDYEFKTVLVGRLPGLHHVHPMLNVQGAGPLLGPGNWLTVTGSHDDFRLPATTLTGQKIDNLETWGMDRVYGWNALWFAIALAWLLWWLRRPLLIPRMRALTEKGGNRAELVTRLDYILGAALIAVTIAIVAIGFMMTEDEYPRTVPLQASRAVVEPLPQQKEAVSVKVEKSTYDVPGRSLKFVLTLTNKGDAPVQIGEFMTSNLRFINHDVPAAMKGVDPKYPKDLLPPTGLFVSDNSPLAPGETRTINMDATDAAWEVERLTSLINDPDNTMGGLLFFFDAKGNRSISDIGGAMTPVFTTADGRS
jgi:methane/ammonia monooxygenase subunit B